MIEAASLRGMLSYDLFIKYGTVFNNLEISREHRLVLEAIREYYNKYRNIKSISVDELQTFFKALNPYLSDRDSEATEELFKDLKGLDITNEELLVDYLNDLVERAVSYEIAQLAMECMQGNKRSVIESIEEHIKSYWEKVGQIQDEEANVCNMTLAELLIEDQKAGLKWRLPFLQEIFKGVKSGSLIHFFGRSETGKTALALSEATYQAMQLKGTKDKILYLTNEEPLKRTKLRAYCAMIGITKEQVYRFQGKSSEYWEKHGGDNLKLIDGADHVRDIEKYINSYKPKIVWIDQGPKVWCRTGGDNRVERLQAVYNKFRQLAKEYDCAILTLGQADSDAEGKRWLDMNNIDGSKVGLQGECDGLIGIGKIFEPGFEEVRFFNVCKNKLTGQFGRKQVHFNVAKNRYE